MAIDKHPTPLNEQDRLEALKALKILDSARAENFDYITAAVAKHYDVPIALVSLVDSERQWFKSKLGLDAEQTARDISFCTYAIMEPRHLLWQPLILFQLTINRLLMQATGQQLAMNTLPQELTTERTSVLLSGPVVPHTWTTSSSNLYPSLAQQHFLDLEALL